MQITINLTDTEVNVLRTEILDIQDHLENLVKSKVYKIANSGLIETCTRELIKQRPDLLAELSAIEDTITREEYVINKAIEAGLVSLIQPPEVTYE